MSRQARRKSAQGERLVRTRHGRATVSGSLAFRLSNQESDLSSRLLLLQAGRVCARGSQMISQLVQIFNDSGTKVRGKLFGIYGVLIAINVLAWVWALVAFRHHPVLLGTCFLAYGFGLRHAVDADHIAAIDNVTRKLMQQGGRPVGVGCFFSLGHSTIVFGLSAAVAATAVAIKNRFDAIENFGNVAGTLMSAFFLLAIAVM